MVCLEQWSMCRWNDYVSGCGWSKHSMNIIWVQLAYSVAQGIWFLCYFISQVLTGMLKLPLLQLLSLSICTFLLFYWYFLLLSLVPRIEGHMLKEVSFLALRMTHGNPENTLFYIFFKEQFNCPTLFWYFLHSLYFLEYIFFYWIFSFSLHMWILIILGEFHVACTQLALNLISPVTTSIFDFVYLNKSHLKRLINTAGSIFFIVVFLCHYYFFLAFFPPLYFFASNLNYSFCMIPFLTSSFSTSLYL